MCVCEREGVSGGDSAVIRLRGSGEVKLLRLIVGMAAWD